MKCGQDFCVYNSGGVCELKEISVDASGGCAKCVLLTIDKKTLDKYKQELLDKYSDEEPD